MTPKLWYVSKLVWLGVLQTVIAVLLSAADLLAKGTITPVDIVLFLAGVLTIIIRVWFTDAPIERSGQ